MIGITGGTGFIGKRLVARLSRTSDVLILSRRAEATLPSRAQCITGDLASSQSLFNFASRCTTIIHLGGIAHTDVCRTADAAYSRTINYHSTRLLLRSALHFKVRRFVYMSTAHVYRPNGACHIDEAGPIAPANFYAQTKIDAEELVNEAADQGLDTVIARPCLVYGPGARFNLERMMCAIDCGYYFHIADKNPQRSFLSVENAARALQHLAAPDTALGVYNLADEQPTSLIELVDDLADRMHRSRPKSVPHSIVRYAGAIGSTLQKYGVRFPITRDAIAKLTADFTLSTRKLSQSGFIWDHEYGQSRQQMVDSYLQSKNMNGMCRYE